MSRPLKTEILSSAHDEECVVFLDRLGQSHPSVLGYHYPMYRDMLTHIGVKQPLYLGAWLGGELVGLLPGFIREAESGWVYCSLPYFGPNAGVICAHDERAESIHSVLLRAVLDYMRVQPNALSASFYTPFLFDQYEYYDQIMPNAVAVPKSTLHLFLPDAGWDSKIQYDLRKAERLGLTISTEVYAERIDTFYKIYHQNCLDYGIPLKPRAAIDYLINVGISDNRVSCYFAFYEGNMVAGLIMMWAPLTASYYIPCTLDSARSLQPGSVLIDRAVNDARKRGIRFWNWESSPSRESGVYRFKKKWGAIESDYRVYVQVFSNMDRFREIGANSLATQFPYFFVYPYNQL